MDWQKERDALINETMALVERVNATKPLAPFQGSVQSPRPEPATPPKALDRQPSPAPVAAMQWGESEREHIAKRVETFKAHQERVRREREDYFFRTMQRAKETAKGRPYDET